MRLLPGNDLRAELEAGFLKGSREAAFVIAGLGSLSEVALRLAGATNPVTLQGNFEILTLAGTIAGEGAHLHMSISDAKGRVTGGHVAKGCIVRTTAEILVAWLPAWSFRRGFDPATGHCELVISRRARPDCPPGN